MGYFGHFGTFPLVTTLAAAPVDGRGPSDEHPIKGLWVPTREAGGLSETLEVQQFADLKKAPNWVPESRKDPKLLVVQLVFLTVRRRPNHDISLSAPDKSS